MKVSHYFSRTWLLSSVGILAAIVLMTGFGLTLTSMLRRAV